MIINIFGASGVGKSTLIEYLERHYPQRYTRLVSYTCRQMRTGETQGNPYYFVPPNYLEENEGWVLKRIRGEDIYAVRKIDLSLNHPQILLSAFPARGVLKLEDLGYVVMSFYLHLENTERIARMRKRGDNDDSIKKRIQEDAFESVLGPTIMTLGTRNLHILDAQRSVEELAIEINEKSKTLCVL